MGFADLTNWVLSQDKPFTEKVTRRCTSCGKDIDEEDGFYKRTSETKKTDGTVSAKAGTIMQPCKKCKNLQTAANRRRRTNAKRLSKRLESSRVGNDVQV